MATVATIIAILLGPILAIQVQKLIERMTQKRQAKKGLFMTLMATRDQRMLREHVQALNMIDVVFSGRGKKDKLVVEAWAEYRDHLKNYPQGVSGKELSGAEKIALRSKQEAWTEHSTELLTGLLADMAASLNYHFDRVLLKKGAYTPVGFGELEGQSRIIARGLTEVFLGIRSLPINIIEGASSETTENSEKVMPEATETDAQQGRNKSNNSN